MHNKGFTLIEIMLVVAIMAILATMAGISTTKTVSKMQFQGTFNNVEQIFHDARSLALSGKQIKDCTDIDGDNDTVEDIVAAGYGVNIDASKGTLTLFSDAHTFDVGVYEDPGEGCGDSIEKTLELPNGYIIGASPDKKDFVYAPPNAVYFGSGDIEIILRNNQYFQKLKITSSGVIEKCLIDKNCD